MNYLLTISLLFLSCTKDIQQPLATETMRINLYATDNSPILVDGVLTNYNNVYCNCVDDNDLIKTPNSSENISLYRESTDLVAERRKLIPSSDTTYLRLWNLTGSNYRLRFVCLNLNHSNLVGLLDDKNFPTEPMAWIKLSDTTYYDFDGTVPQFRFTVYFKQSLDCILSKWSDKVLIKFGVSNETSVNHFEAQRSTDGINFTTINQAPSFNQGSYITSDKGLESGVTYSYRIKVANNDGTFYYGQVNTITF